MFSEDIRFETEQPAQDEEMELEQEDPNAPISAADSWVVIESYFQQHNLVSQQIGSFNNFINNRLQVLVLGSFTQITAGPTWPGAAMQS
jgi:DNA-directed RNA polymerase beta subunit